MNSLHVARGSLVELQTQLEIAERVGIQFDSHKLQAHATAVGQLLNASLRALRRKVANGASRS